MFTTHHLMHRYEKNAVALSDDQVRDVAPSVFAVDKAPHRSARYTYISTAYVVAGMRSNGFEVIRAAEARTRVEDRKGFTAHMVVFRHRDHLGYRAMQLHQRLPEVVLYNAHDGSSSYRMNAGIFECICSNGLVVADATFATIRTPHVGNVLDTIIEGGHHVMTALPTIMETAEVWAGVQLDPAEQLAFARAAIDLRWDTDDPDTHVPVKPDALLVPARYADMVRGGGQPSPAANLWKTFNVVQERIVRGGANGVTAKGDRRKTRGVGSVSENVRLNKALWTLATQMAEIKGVKSPTVEQPADAQVIDAEYTIG